MTLQDRLIAARASKKLSMAAVAKHLGLKSWQAVQQWEKGRAKPSRDNLDALAALYGKPIEFFLHGTLPARAKPALLGPSPDGYAGGFVLRFAIKVESSAHPANDGCAARRTCGDAARRPNQPSVLAF